MKRTLLLICTLLCANVLWAQTFWLDSLRYQVTSTNQVKVYDANSSITTANIPTTVTYEETTYDVTSIGNQAFYYCSSLTSITIPNSVTSIGDSAFVNCSSLTSVTIPNSVTSIGNYAFMNCSSLTSIDIPNSVTSIGYYAFEDCSSLTSVTIPNSVTSIGYYAFYNCSSLTSVTIPNSVTSIENYAFYNCSSLTSVTIPNSVTSIGIGAFHGCSGLTSVNIPNSVTTIGDYAFRNCSSLTSVTIPNSVTSIGSSAFKDCSSLTTLNFNAINCGNFSSNSYYHPFKYCPISTINIGDSVQGIPGYFAYGLDSLTEITIPNSVTSIGDEAFKNCSGLTSVTLPENITSIGQSTFYNAGVKNSIIIDSVTYNVPTATIPESYYAYLSNNRRISNYGMITFHIGDSTYAPATEAMVYDCHGNRSGHVDILSSIEIAGNTYPVTSIGQEAFYYCSSLTSVTIPNSVTSIGKEAFEFCYSLTSVTIPNSVTYIGSSAFYRAGVDATSIIIDGVTYKVSPATIPESYYANLSDDSYRISDYRLITFYIGDSTYAPTEAMVYDCNESRSGHVDILSSIEFAGNTYPVTSIGNGAFDDCSSLTSVTIPNSVISIGYYAFRNCSSLTSVTIPNPVTSIGSSAFYNCSSLTTLNFNAINCNNFSSVYSYYPFYSCPISTINIGDSVQRIPGYFAINLDYLTSVTIPNSVTTIGDSAFYECDGLTSVTIPNNVTAIGINAFSYSDNLSTINFNAINCEDFSSVVFYECPVATINIGVGVQKIPAYFAYGFEQLAQLNIANTVTSIGDFAFRNCSLLNFINIPNSVTYIGQQAFALCTGLTGAIIGNGVTTVGEYAFYGCSNLQNFNFIANNSLTTIGYSAFRYCSNLSTFNIPTSTTSIGSFAFSNCSNLTSISVPESVSSIGRNAFANCPSLANVTLPSNLSIIDTSLFLNCTSLTSIVIPENITNIYSFAFQNCNNLGYITIPENVTYLGSSVFSYCTSLDSISFGENNNINYIGRNAFDSCINLTSINIPNNLTFIDTSTFRYCTSLTSISIPENITAIGPWAFLNCNSLDSINVTNTITYIDDYAFANCNNLNSLSFEDNSNLLYIDYASFWNCSSLTYVNIPNSVSFIGEYAFSDCSNLTEFTIGMGVDSIGNYAFSYCNSLATINFNAVNCRDFTYDNSHPFYFAPISTFNIGEGVQRIPAYLIQNKNLLTSIDIPNSVNSIGTFAFYNCSGLNSVSIGKGVTSIENTAFYGCNNLQLVTSLASIPPTIDYTSFPYPTPAILRVPCHSYSDYSSSATWGIVFDSIESIYYSVDVLANNNTWGNVAIENNCDTAIITATPSNICYQFSGWSDGNTDNPRIVSLSSDTNLTANFQLMTLSTELSATICQGQVYTENGFNVSEAGVYTQTLTSESGCDSIVTLTLNVNPIFNTELSASICQGQVYSENGFNVSEAGVYTQTLQTINGCDSIVTLTLNVNSNNTELSATICQGQVYNEQGFNVSEAGVYTQTLTSVNGCDSIVTLTLNVNPIFNTELSATICQGQVYNEQGFNVSEAGVYTQTLTSVSGCDSIVTLTLSVNPIFNTELSATICQGQVYTENGFNVSEAGVYTQTLTSVSGCDSIVTLTLNVNPVFNTELTATICEGQVYNEQGFNVSEAGVYTQTLTSVSGCDSIVTLSLNVNPIFNTELSANICQGQVYAENGFNVSEAGVYTQTLTSVSGCDSIVTLTLNVNPVFDTTINATINPGETYAEFGFNETEAGTYVQNLQTVNGCDSTITLILSVNSSLSEVEIEEISFYPNPTDSKVIFSQMIEKIEVIDLTGKVIFTFRNESEINVESLPAGAYYLRLTNNDKAVLRKLIKE